MPKSQKFGQEYEKGIPSQPQNEEWSDETYAALIELGEVFRAIRARLISEGYTIERDAYGKMVIVPPKNDPHSGDSGT
jgi:hypothetical protein